MGDKERQDSAFIGTGSFRGTGRDTRLRSDCGQNLGVPNNSLRTYSGLR